MDKSGTINFFSVLVNIFVFKFVEINLISSDGTFYLANDRLEKKAQSIMYASVSILYIDYALPA